MRPLFPEVELHRVELELEDELPPPLPPPLQELQLGVDDDVVPVAPLGPVFVLVFVLVCVWTCDGVATELLVLFRTTFVSPAPEPVLQH